MYSTIDSKKNPKLDFIDLEIISSFADDVLEDLEEEQKPDEGTEELNEEEKEEEKLTKPKEKCENRKREYTYSKFDYFLKPLFGFEFFSQDAFEIFRLAKDFAIASCSPHIETEMLLFGFFQKNSSIRALLGPNNLVAQTLGKYVPIYHSPKKEKKEEVEVKTTIEQKASAFFLKPAKNFFNAAQTKIFHLLSQVIGKLGKKRLLQLIRIINSRFPNLSLPLLFYWLHVPTEFTDTCKKLYLTALENAQKRFNMPVVTTDILFLTFMEEKRTYIGRFIQGAVWDEDKWTLLHFQVLKRIYSHGLALRKFMNLPNLYFAYLLKSRVGEKKYEKEMLKKTFVRYLPTFRSTLLVKARSLNLKKNIGSNILKVLKK